MAKKPGLPPIPRFAYQGGKGKLAKHIIRLLPCSGKRLIEPFAGRGNVYFHVAQRLDYAEFWLNDPYMCRFFVALMHSMEDAMEWMLPERQNVDNEFYKLLKRRAEESIKKEKSGLGISYDRKYRPAVLSDGSKVWAVEQYPPLFVIECFLSYSGGTYESGMKGPSQKNISNKGFMRSVSLAHEIMQRTKPRLTNCDYKDVLVECGPDDVVYLDPPYIKRRVSAYSASTLNHAEMVEMLSRARFKWVLSEYEDEIYKPLTAKFGEPKRIKVRKDMGKVRGGKREDAVECIWRNF
jgi:site-specific DNA-adenine methylase